MADDERNEIPEQRSTSAMIIQSLEAGGMFAGGLGGLGVGVAKVKEAFGGSDQEATPPVPQPPKE